jgi:hypothetical protein
VMALCFKSITYSLLVSSEAFQNDFTSRRSSNMDTSPSAGSSPQLILHYDTLAATLWQL